MHETSHYGALAQSCLCTAGRKLLICQSRHTEPDTKQSNHSEQREQLTREDEVPGEAAPRSPFNTGSMDITTAGATASLCGHPIPAEKTIVIIRHGMTTWNEEQRIQASTHCRLVYVQEGCCVIIVMATCFAQPQCS